MSARYEVRADHPAWDTSATSGRIAGAHVAAEAEALIAQGCVRVVVVDHHTGREQPFDRDWRPLDDGGQR